jgi:arylsulfatase A-like enzyme
MAGEGLRFTQFSSASAVCSPSRASLLTGRYAPRTGAAYVLQATDSHGLLASEVTIAQMLKNAGYRTMCAGKWHLGCTPDFMPNKRGFDEFFGVPYSVDMNPLPLMHNTDVIEQPANLSTLTQRYTQQAINFISGSKDQPFFLYFAHSFPHIPLACSSNFKGVTGIGKYADTIAEIDYSVGQVLQALQKNNIDNNTLVVFTSDHGPWYQGSAGNLRGRKGETYEGGMRVPFIARFPGSIPAGVNSTGFGTALDVLPAIASLTGAPLPPNPLDGVDIWPMLAGARNSVDRDIFLYIDTYNIQAARVGDWKLHVSRYNTPPWVPMPKFGRHNLPLANAELYNVARDPGESSNAAADYPAIVADIRQRIENVLPTMPNEVQSAWKRTFSTEVQWSADGAWPVAAASTWPLPREG